MAIKAQSPGPVRPFSEVSHHGPTDTTLTPTDGCGLGTPPSLFYLSNCLRYPFVRRTIVLWLFDGDGELHIGAAFAFKLAFARDRWKGNAQVRDGAFPFFFLSFYFCFRSDISTEQ